jgi:hypothetical protein
MGSANGGPTRLKGLRLKVSLWRGLFLNNQRIPLGLFPGWSLPGTDVTVNQDRESLKKPGDFEALKNFIVRRGFNFWPVRID